MILNPKAVEGGDDNIMLNINGPIPAHAHFATFSADINI